MNITEFLEARIAEDEAVAKLYAEGNHPLYIYDDGVLGWPDGEWDDGTPHLPNRHTGYAVAYDPARVLAECAAKRAIVKFHEEWPVLVEREPKFDAPDPLDVRGMAYRASQQIAWMTQREYINRFGAEPPTTRMIEALAAVYSDHPDYQQEWAL